MVHKEVLVEMGKKQQGPAVVKLNEAIGRFKVCAYVYVHVYAMRNSV